MIHEVKFDLKQELEYDIQMNFTPDLTSLRYYGAGIPVFLYDELSDYSNLASALDNCKPLSSNFTTTEFSAMTMDKYVPFKNVSDNQGYYDTYMLQTVKHLSRLYSGTVELRRVKGKLITMSLDALQDIDRYYTNGISYNRKVISIKPNERSKVVYKVFAYFADVDMITKYDPHKKEYKLLNGMELSPYSVCSYTNELSYQYSRPITLRAV